MKEIWKDIEEFKGVYQISNLGNVRSLDIEKEYNPIDRKPYKKMLKGKMLKTRTTSDGRKCITLYKDNVKRFRLIHMMVASAFLENPFEYEFVEFIDRDKSNPVASNLRWISGEEAYEINNSK